MHVIDRARRYARIAGTLHGGPSSPPFLVLFVTSLCNMRCEHCFYWRGLNGGDDLTLEELVALSRSMGRIENLNLSGGEPFLRKELAEICLQFVRHNGVREIYVPTNGFFTERTLRAVAAVLEEPALRLFVVELSLDGMSAFHDELRVTRHAFEHAMRTYDALAELQARDPRLRIHAVSTATERNLEEIRRLTTYLFDRCPAMDHHDLAIIRGDRRNPALRGPALARYEALYDYIRRLWAPREAGRYGTIVEPMLQWAKVRTVEEGTQVVPCAAGRLSCVVYANGDVGLCETHPPVGNLRRRTFPEIWASPEARALRERIAARECHCTTEVFLWPSIVFQPVQLARAMLGGRAWRRPLPLAPGERSLAPIDPQTRLPTRESPPAVA